MIEKTDSPETNNTKLDPIYFLGSNDNLGNLITTIQLKENNFDDWARAVCMSLNAKRKLGFLDGTIPKPTTADKLADWRTIHSMLDSWLCNTMSPQVHSSISFF